MFDASNATPQVLDLMTIVDIEMKRMLCHDTQGPVHVVLACLIRPDVAAGKILAEHISQDETFPAARTLVKAMYPVHSEDVQVIYFTDNMKLVFRHVTATDKESRAVVSLVTTRQLLHAICIQEDLNVMKLFTLLKVDRVALANALINDLGWPKED